MIQTLNTQVKNLMEIILLLVSLELLLKIMTPTLLVDIVLTDQLQKIKKLEN